MCGVINERVDDGELINVTGSEPAEIRPSGTYAEVRQNFANWFQYYVKREFSAKAAIGGVIVDGGTFDNLPVEPLRTAGGESKATGSVSTEEEIRAAMMAMAFW